MSRLADEFYTEAELAKWRQEVMVHPRMVDDRSKGWIVALKLYGPHGDTGKRMLTWAQELGAIDGVVDKEWADTGIRTVLADYREGYADEAVDLLNVLDKWKYKPKFDRIGADRIISWEPWMVPLVKGN